MLEGLESIDWDGLNASGIPKWVFNLSSSDSEIYREAAWQLESRIDHIEEYYTKKDDILEVEILIIPFLFELLQEREIHCRPHIISLLDMLTYFFDDERIEKFKPRSLQLRSLLKDGLDIYISLLDEKNSRTQRLAIMLIQRFREFHQILVSLLFQKFTDELNQETKAYIVWTLGEIISDNDKLRIEFLGVYRRLLEECLQFPDHTPSRIVAAVRFMILAEDILPKAVIDTIAIYLQDKTDGTMTYVPTLFEEFGRQIKKRETSESVMLLLPLIGRIKGTFTLFEILALLLDIAFEYNVFDNYVGESMLLPDGSIGFINYVLYDDKGNFSPKQSTILELTISQQNVLSTLVNEDRIWEFPTNLFDIYNLPNNRDELRALL